MYYTEDPLSINLKLKLLTNRTFYATMLLLLFKNSMNINILLVSKIILNNLVFVKRYARLTVLSLLIAILSFQMVIPQTQAKTINDQLSNVITQMGVMEIISNEYVVDGNHFPNTFPESEKKPLFSKKISVSAYNSLAGQTDDSPCIAARGYDLCSANQENVIAANFLPIGTIVKFPEIFGDKEFTVVDRMNPRYYYKADFWMRNYNDAIKFGTKYTTIEVYGYR